MSLYLSNDETIKWEHAGKLYCLHIMLDGDALNPREDDGGLLTTMACWHRYHNLGDDIGKNISIEDWWRGLVKDNIPYDEFAKALFDGELSVKAVKRDDKPERYDVMYKCDDELWHTDYYSSDVSYGSLRDIVLEDLEVSDCMKLMENYAVWLPLWLYDHSGISMSCGARQYPYNDRWDSGQVGWILMTKQNALTIYDAENDGWQKVAIKTMQYEVEMYDEWLRGECFGYELYEADKPEDGEKPDWGEEEADSCWGFYGDDIIKNDMAWNVGFGLKEAIESGKYEVGTAERHVVSFYTF